MPAVARERQQVAPDEIEVQVGQAHDFASRMTG
jgi:hypothetical protein